MVGGTATGKIAVEDDADWFKVTVEAGRTYQIDLEGQYTGQGTVTDPILLGIYDRNGAQIPHSWDDFGGGGDNARLYFQPEANGTYYISATSGIADRGGENTTGTYRLSVADVTDTEISASIATAASVAVGGTATGEIDVAGDQDWFRVELTAGTTYLIEQRGIVGFLDERIPDGGTLHSPWKKDWRGEDEPDYGTLLTPLIRGIRDADGDLIAGTEQRDLVTLWLHHSSDTESKPYYRGQVEFTPDETGTHYISAGSYVYTGTYELSVEEVVDGM